MKHLKKLSVAIMMVTLFSGTFTSCIDNEVSPLVEAIYEAQADLIAAQAGVQNAEAALLLAQANAVEAQTAAQAQVNADLAAGQLAVLLANAGLTNAQSAMILAQAEALADMTAAQVLGLIADADLTDAQASLIIAQSNAIEDLTAAQVLGLIASANLTDAQAAMVLAQSNAVTNLNAAEVAQLLANAGYTEAETAELLAEIARYQAETAQNALLAEQNLLQVVAETNLAVAEAQNDLALAQITFQTQMAAAMAAMEAAGAQLAVGYAWDYALAMQHANNLMQQLLGAQADLASAELMQNGDVSWEFYLAQLQGEVATTMAAKASIEDAIADLEAYIANPTTPEAIITALKAENDALDALRDAKEIEMQIQYNKIMAIYEQNGVRNDVDDRIFDSLDEHNYAVDERNDRVDWIADANEEIADWQTALDDYDGALEALEQAVDDATTIKNQMQIAYDDASDIQIEKNDAQIAAELALSDLEDDLDTLYEALQDAANTLATQQAIYDSGIGAVTTANTNAGTAIITAGANLAIAQDNYELWRDRFENVDLLYGPYSNGGYTWEDPGTDPFAPLLGIQDPTTNVTTASYVLINFWNAGTVAVDDNFAGTYELPVVTTLPVGANVIPYGTILTDSEVAAAYPSIGFTEVYYYRVDADDIAYNNLTELNDAIAALGDEDIFDGPPTLGDMPLPGTDAYTNLWNAQLAKLGTQDALDNYGDNLAAAQADYEYWRDLYENELQRLNDAQDALETADSELAAANTAKSNALGDLNDAIADLNDANTDLSNFLSCDDVCLQGNIDAALLDIADWTAEIAAIQPIIDAKFAVVAGLLGELTAAGVTYTFVQEDDVTTGNLDRGTLVITNSGFLSSLYPDLHAAIIAEWQVYWAMEQEMDALDFQENLNDEMISVYGGWNSDDLDDLADDLADLQVDLADAIYDIEVAEQALAAAQVEEAADEAYISYLEALIDTLEQRHANTLAIAAKYKALMDAALLAS